MSVERKWRKTSDEMERIPKLATGQSVGECQGLLSESITHSDDSMITDDLVIIIFHKNVFIENGRGHELQCPISSRDSYIGWKSRYGYKELFENLFERHG